MSLISSRLTSNLKSNRTAISEETISQNTWSVGRVVDFALGGHSVDDVAQHEAGVDAQNLQKKIRFKLKE